MHEIEKMNQLQSLAIFVGKGECNAKCNHCAGKVLRKYAPTSDGILDETLISNTLKNCYEQGARRLTISSSGEPTLSPIAVTRTLELVQELKKANILYNPINLYSNGIRIGKDEEFCKTYLPLWRNLDLTTIHLTVHDINEKENAKTYGIETYPNLEKIIYRIQSNDLIVRTNIILSNNIMNSYDKFVSTINYLNNLGVKQVTAWPIRNSMDELDTTAAISEYEMDKIRNWTKEHTYLDCKITLLDEKSRIVYLSGQKLTLFPDGTLSNTWCNNK